MEKTPGQIAYEQSVEKDPFYIDGSPRKTWDELASVMRVSWNRKTTPKTSPEQQELVECPQCEGAAELCNGYCEGRGLVTANQAAE